MEKGEIPKYITRGQIKGDIRTGKDHRGPVCLMDTDLVILSQHKRTVLSPVAYLLELVV